jgi:hypothetical protein
LTGPPPNAKNYSPVRRQTPGRHHVGILGDIIPESPGGFVGIRNLTGATFYVAQPVSRQLEVLHELLPGAMTIGVLVNPNAPAANVEPQVRDLKTAANALGLRLRVINAANERDAEAAFARSASQAARVGYF